MAQERPEGSEADSRSPTQPEASGDERASDATPRPAAAETSESETGVADKRVKIRTREIGMDQIQVHAGKRANAPPTIQTDAQDGMVSRFLNKRNVRRNA